MKDPVKTIPIKKAKILIAYTIITPVILIAMLIYVTFPFYTQYKELKSSGPIAANDVALTDLTTDQHYFLDPTTVVDSYCYTGDEDDPLNYSLIILFRTGSGQTAAASMTVTPDDAIWDSCMDYLNDTTLEVGDLEFPMYGYTTDLAEDADQNGFYTKAMSSYRSYGLSFTKTELEFHYLGGTLEEYQDYVESQLHSLTVRMIVIGVALLFMIAMSIYSVATILKKIKAAKNTVNEDSDTIPGTPEIR